MLKDSLNGLIPLLPSKEYENFSLFLSLSNKKKQKQKQNSIKKEKTNIQS